MHTAPACPRVPQHCVRSSFLLQCIQTWGVLPGLDGAPPTPPGVGHRIMVWGGKD